MRFLLSAAVVAASLVVGAAGAFAAPKLANQTIVTYSPDHGTQVEYYDAAGNTFLWYPGNQRVLPGAWKLDGDQICFRYGKNTYNPSTRRKGGSWECASAALLQKTVIDRKSGDVFGLARHAGEKTVPYMLFRDRATIAALEDNIAGLEAIGEKLAKEHAVPAKEHCATVLANANKNRAAKIEAAHLYYHGMWMGETCLKVDYVKAITMLREVGETKMVAAMLKQIRVKADSGNPKAIAALQKLGE